MVWVPLGRAFLVAPMIELVVGRNPPVLVSVALFGALVAVLVGWLAFCLARRGGPARWSPSEAYGFVLVAVIGSLGWWWVDGPVEGEAEWVLTERHGITPGDLLVLPALAVAGVVLASRLVRAGLPRRRFAGAARR
jgi:hypothetical protein